MRKINTGGPAFPLQSIGPEFPAGYSGMTLRDYFAAKAMQGLLANPKLQEEILKHGGARGGWIEKSSYAFADSMLIAKEEDNA